MDLGISGKTALVAGGSAGLGKASAMALAREGVRLFVSARGEQRLLATAQDIRDATGAAVTAVVANHGTEAGRRALADACPAPDILVITFSPPPFTDDYRHISIGEWQESIDTTLIGSIELMRHFSQGMVERGFGRIVNIGTIAAKYPIAQRILSGSTRAAVTNYAVGLAKVVARHDVVINSIMPGIFQTPGLDESFVRLAEKNGTTAEAEADRFLRRLSIPARTYGDPDDLGALCAMLCSRHARYVVGQSLAVDGGLGSGLF